MIARIACDCRQDPLLLLALFALPVCGRTHNTINMGLHLFRPAPCKLDAKLDWPVWAAKLQSARPATNDSARTPFNCSPQVKHLQALSRLRQLTGRRLPIVEHINAGSINSLARVTSGRSRSSSLAAGRARARSFLFERGPCEPASATRLASLPAGQVEQSESISCSASAQSLRLRIISCTQGFA